MTITLAGIPVILMAFRTTTRTPTGHGTIPTIPTGVRGTIILTTVSIPAFITIHTLMVMDMESGAGNIARGTSAELVAAARDEAWCEVRDQPLSSHVKE